jgi:hypothetical protein
MYYKEEYALRFSFETFPHHVCIHLLYIVHTSKTNLRPVL